MSMIESIKDTFADMSYALEEVAEKTLGAVKACGKFVWEVFDEITGGNPVLAVIAIAAITVIGFFIYWVIDSTIFAYRLPVIKPVMH